jgi:hypothetical protein
LKSGRVMNKSNIVLVKTLGIIAGCVGIEHGIGELLQGFDRVYNVFILSWPHSAFFKIMAGEPAFTLFPVFFLAGFFSIIFSLLFVIMILFLLTKKYALPGLLMAIGLMFISGAGFGTTLLGISACLIATKNQSGLTLWSKIPGKINILFSKIWIYSYTLCITGWISLFPGAPVISQITMSENEYIMIIPMFVSFVMIPITMVTGFSKDIILREKGHDFVDSKKESFIKTHHTTAAEQLTVLNIPTKANSQQNIKL